MPGYVAASRAFGNRTGRSARHGRLTRPRDSHDIDRQTPSGLGAAVELRLGKIRTGQTQDLVGFTQLAALAFQSLNALALFGGRPRTLTSIGLMAVNPAIQRLRNTADLRRDGLNGCPL